MISSVTNTPTPAPPNPSTSGTKKSSTIQKMPQLDKQLPNQVCSCAEVTAGRCVEIFSAMQPQQSTEAATADTSVKGPNSRICTQPRVRAHILAQVLGSVASFICQCVRVTGYRFRRFVNITPGGKYMEGFAPTGCDCDCPLGI